MSIRSSFVFPDTLDQHMPLTTVMAIPEMGYAEVLPSAAVWPSDILLIDSIA